MTHATAGPGRNLRSATARERKKLAEHRRGDRRAYQHEDMKIRTLQIWFFTTLLLSVPAFAQSGRETGIDFYLRGKYQESADILKPVVKADKKDKLARMFLGAALLGSHHQSDAVAAFRKGNLRTKDQIDFYDKQLDVTSKPRPSYTDTAHENMVTGKVQVVVEFLDDGKIGFVYPLEQLSGGLTENCLSVAKRIKFHPAQRNGKPVTTLRIVEYSFDIY